MAMAPYSTTLSWWSKFKLDNLFSAVLSLYFKFLKFSEDDSIILFHSFVSLCYFAPILGATLADSFLGKFRTIFYLCCIYILGELVLTLGAVGDREDGNEGIEGMPAA